MIPVVKNPKDKLKPTNKKSQDHSMRDAVRSNATKREAREVILQDIAGEWNKHSPLKKPRPKAEEVQLLEFCYDCNFFLLIMNAVNAHWFVYRISHVLKTKQVKICNL